jgi:hypothetical protein
MDFSKRSKILLEFLDSDANSLRLFEELVLKGGVLTLEEFFGSKDEIRKKLTALDYRAEQVDRIVSFITFDKIRFEGNDLIFLKNRDKEILYENFKELREEFDKNCFGKFNDRLYEEAMFWDELFKRQLKEESFLYGNAIDDSKVRNNLPCFIKSALDQLPKDSALDLGDNFDDVQTNQVNEKFIAVGNFEQVPLINSINNHSLAILYKNVSNMSISKNKYDENEDFEEFQILRSNLNPDANSTRFLTSKEAVSNKDTLNQKDPRKSYDAYAQQNDQSRNVSKDDAVFQKDFHNVLKSIHKSVAQKIEEGQMNTFFGNSENNDNVHFVNSMHVQIQKFEQSENFLKGKDHSFYNEDFMIKYKEFNERARHLLVIFYSMFPISLATDKDKVKTLWKTINGLKDELLKFKAELKSKMRTEEYEAHKYPIDFLSKLIHDNTAKLGQYFN